MEALDIGRAVFPDATDEWLEGAIWSHTGYPAFWRRGNPVKQMYQQLRRLKRVLDKGGRPCDFCTSPLEDDDRFECKKCRAALDRAAGRMVLMIDEVRLRAFIRESNHIEGIEREPTAAEISIARWFLSLAQISVQNLRTAVDVFQPGARLRDKVGMDVRVGNHIPPRGGPEIRTRLETLLTHMHKHAPHAVHCSYEELHAFTDGNGRSGRLLWLWMMVKRDGVIPPLGFLHTIYYQMLAASDD